jgi:hypothetical protein
LGRFNFEEEKNYGLRISKLKFDTGLEFNTAELLVYAIEGTEKIRINQKFLQDSHK